MATISQSTSSPTTKLLPATPTISTTTNHIDHYITTHTNTLTFYLKLYIFTLYFTTIVLIYSYIGVKVLWVLVPSSLVGFLGFHPYMCLFSLRKLFCWLFYSTEGNLLFNIKMKHLHFVLLYRLFWWLAFFGDLGRLFYHDYSIADCYRF